MMSTGKCTDQIIIALVRQNVEKNNVFKLFVIF